MPLYPSKAWRSYSPTITVSSGTITTLGTVIGRYLQDGKFVAIELDIPITTNGTGSGALRFTLPVSASTTAVQFLCGKEINVTGAALAAQLNVSSGALGQCTKYDNGYPGGDGTKICLTGVYEAA